MVQRRLSRNTELVVGLYVWLGLYDVEIDLYHVEWELEEEVTLDT